MLRINEMKLLNGKVLSLDAKTGEAVQLTGVNGVGKSLFLKSISKIIPSTYLELSLDSKSHDHYSTEEWRSKILYVSPDFYADPEFTVEDFFNEPLQYSVHKNLIRTFDYKTHFKDSHQLLSSLSSGQRQQISLLRALSLKPKYLLLDEPFGYMDNDNRSLYIEILHNFIDQGNGLIFVSHVKTSLSGDRCFEIR